MDRYGSVGTGWECVKDRTLIETERVQYHEADHICDDWRKRVGE